MSKYFLFFVILLALSINTRAQQRFADLEVSLKEPVPGEVVSVNSPFDVTVKLYNRGADTIKATDTLRFSLSFDTSVILFLVDTATLDYIPETGIEIYPEDSVNYKFQFGVGTGWDTGFTNFCVKVVPVNSVDTFGDTALNNNKGCVTMRIIDPSLGISKATKKLSSVDVYPNPVTDVLNFKVDTKRSHELIKVTLTNMLGRVVSNQSGTSTEIQFDVSDLAPGLYGYTVTVGAERYYGKVKVK